MYLEHMNYLEVEEYLKHDDRIILPVGSLENHGKHMPLGTDTMVPQHIAQLMEEKGNPVVIAPAVPYGATDDLTGFAGTVSLGVEGLTHLLTTICDQLYAYGFRKFIILNGHGGNSKSIDTVGIHLYDKGAILACVNWWLIAGQLRPEWRGGHGGGEETAAVMGIDPSLIKYEFINEPEGVVNDISDQLPSASWTSVTFEGASITIPRKIRSITDNGWLEHGMAFDPPTKATPEWGTQMLSEMADYVLRFAKVLSEVNLHQPPFMS